MTKPLVAFLSGLLFGVGLALSQMVNPAKVIGFLDFAGNWDPTLAFVMAGALAVTIPAFHFILRRPAPVLEVSFSLPARGEIDGRLVGGAALFGVGWGISGFCPGPAIASLAFGLLPSVVFVLSMVAGIALYHVSLAPGAIAAAADG